MFGAGQNITDKAQVLHADRQHGLIPSTPRISSAEPRVVSQNRSNNPTIYK